MDGRFADKMTSEFILKSFCFIWAASPSPSANLFSSMPISPYPLERRGFYDQEKSRDVGFLIERKYDEHLMDCKSN
jgi:hypothetical protein